MIDWAAPLLGQDHPGLVAAKAHFDTGAYLDALLAVHEALRVAIDAGEV